MSVRSERDGETKRDGCAKEGMRERERDGDRQTERETDRERDRQMERERERQRERDQFMTQCPGMLYPQGV